MEWLGLLLLYLISGYMKKRQQDAKRREIESDPDWDISEETPQEKPKTNLDQMLKDLFDQASKFDPEAMITQQFEDDEESDLDELETVTESAEEFENEILQPDEHDLSSIDEQAEAFEEKIYHSELADRKEQHYGKKWKNKGQLRAELFENKKSLKKAIILKEVLDKPLALR